jgi:hypothetical protein
MNKKTGEPIANWYKMLIGLLFIFLIVGLSLGPMFLFSTLNLFGDANPVSQPKLNFMLKV